MARLLSFLRAPASRSANFAYVNARVRAKKASLLPADTWPKLLVRDAHEIARFLQENGYKDEIDAFAGRYSGSELVEHATRVSLGARYQEILSYCGGPLRTMVTLYLERYDVYNLKTILRGKFSDVKSEEILEELIHAGAVPRDRLEALARTERFDDVLAAIVETPLGRDLADVAKGKQLENLVEVENAIDKAYYRLLLEAIPTSPRPNRVFRDFIRREIDVVNLMTLFRLRAEGLSEFAPYFVPGGAEVNEARASRIVRASPDEVATEIAQLSFGERIEAGVRTWRETNNLNAAILALERALIAESSGFSHRNPLSILPIIDYILRKRREVDNLRILATGKATNLGEDVIKELLVT